MIFGVDGTGPFRDSEYKSQMANSFVSQICRSPGGRYWRGPDAIDTFLGGPNPREVAEAIRMVVVPMADTPRVYGTGFGPAVVVYPTSKTELSGLKDKVFLTGYSRGAATMLDVAVILKSYGIPVEAMFLFDSVTRSPWLSATSIPSNVRHFYHALRKSEAGSRNSFGNSTPVPEPGVTPLSESFFTTHAGMGGVPWGPGGLIKPVPKSPVMLPPGLFGGTFQTPTEIAGNLVAEYPEKYGDKIFEGAPDWAFTNVTVAQENTGMNAVRSWMWGHLNQHGIAPMN